MHQFKPRRLAALTIAASLALQLPGNASAQLAQAVTNVGPRSLTGVRFRFAADGAVRGGFGLSRGRLLFGTENGSFYALDAQSGQLAWRIKAGSPVLSTPAISGGRAYFTTLDNRLHAIEIATGRSVWTRDLGKTLGTGEYWEYYTSSPVIDGQRLFVGSGSGELSAINIANGKTIWSKAVGARIRSTPALGGDAVVIGTMAGHVIAFDHHDGRLLWDFATDGAGHEFSFKSNDTRSVVTSPIIIGGLVVAGGRDGNIYGIDLKTGKKRWNATHDGGSWILGLAADSRNIYSASGSALIVQGMDPASGKETWRTGTGNAMFGDLALAGDVLVSNGHKGNVFALSASTGAALWRFTMPDMALASPLIAQGVVFTGSDDGSVVAIATSSVEGQRLDRMVYSFTDQPLPGFFWFAPEVLGGIQSNFEAAGYKRIGNKELVEALDKPTGEDGRKLIVLADTRLPDGVDGARLRRFLDGGGSLVLIGPDPVEYDFDTTGAPANQDSGRSATAFGITAPDRQFDSGFNAAKFTAFGATLGLTGSMTVTNSWARPDQVSEVIAADRLGMAVAWTKRFANGGLLINFPLPQIRAGNLANDIGAIDVVAGRREH